MEARVKHCKINDLFGQGLFASTVSGSLLVTFHLLERKLALNWTIPWQFAQGAALVLLALAVGVYAWALHYLALSRQNRALITTGPYALVRHPRYAALVFLVYPACALVLNSGLGLVAVPLIYAVFVLFIRREEEHLVLLFGADYQRYRSHTPALLPRWTKAPVGVVSTRGDHDGEG